MAAPVGAIGQVVVVVIRLKHIEQDFDVDLPFVAVGDLRLQSGKASTNRLRVWFQSPPISRVSYQAHDLAIRVDLPHQVWG